MSNSPFFRRDEAVPISDVNVVPLADVSLVLLIILLVLSPMAAQSMLKIQAAAAKSETSKVPSAGEDPLKPTLPEPVLSVGLSSQGYLFDGHSLTNDRAIYAALKPRLVGREDKKVFLTPELDVPNGRVVHAIETLQACGAATVALVQVYDPEAGSPR